MIRIIEKRRKVMKKALQVILTLSLVCFMLASMAETTVTMLTYRSGEDVGAVFFLPQIERFNAKFAGKYKIVVEESPSNTHTDRIKQLALQNKLPFAFQVSDSKWVEDYLIANGKLQDLSAFINERPEMKSRFISESVNFCTKDGKVIALPITVLKPTGLYYNTALFSPGKDITELSWEEFSKALGDNKISYQTAEGGWTVSLMLTGILGTLENGPEILKAGVQNKITDFNTPLFQKAFAILQQSFLKNGWSGAIGATYPDAANAFYANQTAVLPDGTWIISKVYDNTDWAGGFDGTKVSGDYFPGNVAIADPWVYDWMMPANLSDEEKGLAYAFFEFMCEPEEIEAFILAEGGSAPNIQYSENFDKELSKNKLMSDFASKLKPDTTYVPYFSGAISSSLFLGDFTNYLPNLYTGEWTPEKFCEELTKSAQE
jgi:raffinose/stachyose/melibiose transport system substrate-binding protein